MLEGWDIYLLKGGIYSSVWCTKNLLYDIRELRYKQIKMGYQISKIFNIGQSSVLKSAVPYCFIYISAPLCFTDMGFNFEACSSLLEMFIAREILHKSRRYQIYRYWLIIISNSWNLIPHMVFLISQLPDIVQKSFCTPDWAMGHTF